MKTIGAYVKRVRALGWPFLLTGLAFLLGVVALSQPVWTEQQVTTGGDVNLWTYGWTVVIEEQWQGGVWASTTYTPYTSPSFTDFRMREAVSNSYAIATAFVAAVFVLGLLQWLAKPRKISPNLTLLMSLVTLGLGIASVAYPALAIPAAANADLSSSISGFSGSVFVNGPGSNDYTLSWGGAVAWWLWVASALLVGIVFAVPLLQRKPWSRASPAH